MFSSARALAQQFNDHFEVKIAKTPEQQRKVFKIRGDVYCKEFQYEPEENCPNGLESDHLDAQSIHCLIVHRKLNIAAGCIRLISLPQDATHNTLPFEQFVGASDCKNKPPISALSRNSVAEYSRLAVHGSFRRSVDSNVDDGFSQNERTVFPLITTALFMASYALSALTNKKHNFAMIEPRLFRLIRCASGVNWHQIGDVIDYHGPRAPFYITTNEALKSIHRSKLWRLYETVYAALEADLAPTPLHAEPVALPLGGSVNSRRLTSPFIEPLFDAGLSCAGYSPAV